MSEQGDSNIYLQHTPNLINPLNHSCECLNQPIDFRMHRRIITLLQRIQDPRKKRSPRSPC